MGTFTIALENNWSHLVGAAGLVGLLVDWIMDGFGQCNVQIQVSTHNYLYPILSFELDVLGFVIDSGWPRWVSTAKKSMVFGIFESLGKNHYAIILRLEQTTCWPDLQHFEPSVVAAVGTGVW